MKVATWNVDSVRARWPRLEAWLVRCAPDVLCLQEIKCATARFPAEACAALGYVHQAVHGHGGRGGVAIVSRQPLSDPVLGIPGAVAPLAEPRSVSATVAGIRLHTVYAPNGRKVGLVEHDVKLAWFELLGRWMEIDGMGDRPTLLVGDLNIAPTDLDVWEPRRYRKRNLTSPRERAAFDQLLDRGLVDVLRSHLGDRQAFTWWNRRAGFFETDRGWRLDHVLADTRLASRIGPVHIDRDERAPGGATPPSDHAPVLVTIGDR